MEGGSKNPIYKRWSYWIVAAFVLMIVLLAQPREKEGVLDEASKIERAERWKTRDNSTMAYIMVEKWVKDRLKSPSTADFPGVFDGRRDHVKPLGDQRYGITSWVDSQNSFGATIRTKFAAIVRQTSEDRWELETLGFDE